MHFESDEILVTIVIGTALIVFFGGVIFFLFFLFQKKKLRHIREKQTLQVQFKQELLQTRIEIQEQTLETISQEIHDNVGQVLSLAKLNLNTVGAITDERMQSKIESTKELVSKAINDLRDLSRSLHGEKTGEIGLQDAIANELKILQNIGQLETDLKLSRQPYKLDPQKEMVLFRIVQEALHNTVKHANASHVTVLLNYDDGIFSLTVTDDGNGFQPGALASLQTGIGLKSMQSRAVLIGGQLSVLSSENGGTSISVKIPTLKH